MKKTIMALAVSAGLTLAPISAALAGTVASQPEGAIASAWVPATLAEQQAARGGGQSYPGLSPLISALNTVCSNFSFTIRLNGGYNMKSSYIYCGRREG